MALPLIVRRPNTPDLSPVCRALLVATAAAAAFGFPCPPPSPPPPEAAEAESWIWAFPARFLSLRFWRRFWRRPSAAHFSSWSIAIRSSPCGAAPWAASIVRTASTTRQKRYWRRRSRPNTEGEGEGEKEEEEGVGTEG